MAVVFFCVVLVVVVVVAVAVSVVIAGSGFLCPRLFVFAQWLL